MGGTLMINNGQGGSNLSPVCYYIKMKMLIYICSICKYALENYIDDSSFEITVFKAEIK